MAEVPAFIRWLKSIPGERAADTFVSDVPAFRRWGESLPGGPDGTKFLAGDFTWKVPTGGIGIGEYYVTPLTDNPADILGYGTWQFLGTVVLV